MSVIWLRGVYAEIQYAQFTKGIVESAMENDKKLETVRLIEKNKQNGFVLSVLKIWSSPQHAGMSILFC